MKYEIDKILITIKHYKMVRNSWIIIEILEHVTCSMICKFIRHRDQTFRILNAIQNSPKF